MEGRISGAGPIVIVDTIEIKCTIRITSGRQEPFIGIVVKIVTHIRRSDERPRAVGNLSLRVSPMDRSGAQVDESLDVGHGHMMVDFPTMFNTHPFRLIKYFPGDDGRMAF
ncbi:hypothetical protein ES703_84863 [subsurface metagenome]